MSVLSSLKLTPEQVRRMTASAPKPTKRTESKNGRDTVPSWIWEWIASLEDGTEFTTDDVVAKTGKIKPTAQSAIRLALKRGLIDVAKKGVPGIGIRQFTRTEIQTTPKPHESQAMARIRALKAGAVVDYLTIKATSEQAGIHVLRRASAAGLLKPAEWRVRSGTVYRRVTK